MKKLLLILSLTFSGCATFFKEPDLKFDCARARLYDFHNNVRFVADRTSFRSQFSKIYCEGDPTSLDYWGSTRPTVIERSPPK